MSTKPTDYVGGLYDEFRGNHAVGQQALIERFYLRYLTELACNRFKWSGFPDAPEGDIRVRYLELTLFRYAVAVFFRHKDFDKYLALRATQSGNLDMYFDPEAYHLYSNGHTPGIDGLTVNAKDCVPIWANYLRCPDLDLVSIYVRRIAKFDRTIEINLNALRHPYIIVADDTTRHSMANFFRQIDEGQPLVTVQGALADSLEKLVKVFDMKLHPDTISNLLLDKKKAWQECMTFLGINNANQDKKERLVVAEVSANDSEIMMARKIALDSRQLACEQINKKYGLNVSVEWNVDVDKMAEMPDAAEATPETESANA